METTIHFAGLMITTLFALGAAVALDWILLRAAFQLMQPATARHSRTVRSELVKATQEFAGPLAQQAKL